ncbi:MAG: hypothetical protein WD341_16200 [Tistlia sp.]|uniref:hypothetical protein n=1 Tax=Tistlia sp. TaxID=3057121 RepID=UPI0034A44AD6
MTVPQLAIRRLHLILEVDPGETGRRAQEAETALRARLADRLAAHLPGEGEEDASVLLIRRLAVELTHPAAAPLDLLAERLAEAIAAGVAAAGSAQSGVLRFPDRAAHAAAFIGALLEGSAWDRWWFRGFSGLRALPPGAAVRTLLSRDWQSAPRVLAACPPPQRARLWRVLAPEEAATILTALAAGPGGAPGEAVWSAMARALLDSGDLPDPVAALAAVVEAAAAPGTEGIAWLVPIARRAAELRPLLLDDLPGAETPTPDGRDGGGRSTAPPDARLRLPAPLLEALRLARAAEGERAVPAEGWRASPLLGFALLLPALHELPLETAVQDWPRPETAEGAGPPAAELVRLLILAAAAGAEAALWRDPLWRDLYRLPGVFDAPAIAAWSAAIPAPAWRGLPGQVAVAGEPAPLGLPRSLVPGGAARAALGRLAGQLMLGLAQGLPGFAGASPAFLRGNLLGAGGSALLGREAIRIRLNRPPLDVLLGMSGLAEREVRLDDGRRLVLERWP